jgi:cytochrome P450
MPKWNPVLGHLLALDEAYKKYSLPVDLHRHDLFGAISKDFPETDGLYYADVWPFINPLLIITSPLYAVQACQQHKLAKPADLVSFLHPITGGNTIFTSNGDEWKKARSLFSSGFNSAYISSQTEHIVQEAEVYVNVLEEHARSGDIFLLDDVHLKYTMNISGILTLLVTVSASQRM